MAFCFTVSVVLFKINLGAGIAYMVIFCGWNWACIRSLLRIDEDSSRDEDQSDEHRKKSNCLNSCLSVMLLMTASFTLITRYYYFEYFPKQSNRRENTTFVFHKTGLILLLLGIPVIYGYELQSLINNKEMIDKVVVDFIDIYEMARVLDLGAPTCTRGLSECTESINTAMRKGGTIEVAVQGFCSLSFLFFFLIYKEALYESENSQESLRKYIKYTFLLQDIPFFLIRIVIWMSYGFQIDQFIFLVKNVLSTVLTILDLREYRHS